MNLIKRYLNKQRNDKLLKICATEDNLQEPSTKQTLRDIQEKTHEEKWKKKVIHGKYFNDVEALKIADYSWLKKAQLKKETEALIMAAQENSLRLNYIKFTVDHTINSGTCRMCHQYNETVQHVLCGCPKMAKIEYTQRHDRVGKVIHWALMKKYGFDTSDMFYHHSPQPVIENSECKILWDFPIRTDKSIKSQRPDVTVIIKKPRQCLLIDFSIPFDTNVKTKTEEKIEKYGELVFEVKRLWNMEKVEVLPIIVGALGSMWRQHLVTQLKKLGIDKIITISTLQKEALLGSATILRKTLNA